MYSNLVKNLVEAFKYFPGVGEKTAKRMAFYVLLDMDNDQANFLADSIKLGKDKIKRCKNCNNITENDICLICQDKTRDSETLCIVEDPKTVVSIEELGVYHGYYHVLNGLISTKDGVNFENIQLDKLLKRLEEASFKEVIIAVKPCLEGELTACYIKDILSQMNIIVSRLASGIPMGADMEYVDPITLESAFNDRKKIS